MKHPVCAAHQEKLYCYLYLLCQNLYYPFLLAIQIIETIVRVSPQLQNDTYQIIIKADKVPLGERAGRFNASTLDEVNVIIVGDPIDKRAIKITRRDNTVSTISDLNRSYENCNIH